MYNSKPDRHITNNNQQYVIGIDGAVGKSSANGFASRLRLQLIADSLKHQWVGVRPLHSLFFH